ncbi:MAG: hypothetical protein U5R48_01485 [Gammaproteobacteria bacterium]|nr:hypothetical protein [Gammaproteobacteria bacterium]
MPLIVEANRHMDIMTALRLQQEFGFRMILSGAADAPLVLDEIRQRRRPGDRPSGDGPRDPPRRAGERLLHHTGEAFEAGISTSCRAATRAMSNSGTSCSRPAWGSATACPATRRCT